MNAIRVIRQLSSHIVETPELAEMVGKRVQIIVLEEPEPRTDGTPTDGPRADTAKGQAVLSSDFDAPLDDFSEYT